MSTDVFFIFSILLARRLLARALVLAPSSARDFLLRLMVVVSADHSEHQPPVEPRGLASGWPSLLTVVMETDIGLEQPRLLQLSIPLK